MEYRERELLRKLLFARMKEINESQHELAKELNLCVSLLKRFKIEEDSSKYELELKKDVNDTTNKEQRGN